MTEKVGLIVETLVVTVTAHEDPGSPFYIKGRYINTSRVSVLLVGGLVLLSGPTNVVEREPFTKVSSGTTRSRTGSRSSQRGVTKETRHDRVNLEN